MSDDSIQIHKASQPQISMTPKALTHTRKWLEKTKGIGLRLSTKMTGCSGLEYVVDIVHEANQDDVRVALEEDILIFIDKQALTYLNGSKLDYVQDGINFKFVFENPNATGVCGCGESFTVD